jgi:hypothetical protein
VIDVAHDGYDGWTNPGFRCGLLAGGGRVHLLGRLFFERNHICIRSEEARHLACQFRVKRLVDRGKYAF